MNEQKHGTGAIRILLADDHAIVREGLRALLSRKTDVVVIAECSDGLSTVAAAKRLLPDIVLMDISMPGLNGIEATRHIAAELPDIRVIALSMHVDKYMVGMTINAGARGFLPKDCASEELVTALHAVMDQRYYISANLGFHVHKSILRASELHEFVTASSLTNKEREVIQLIAEGRSSKEIAARLHISVKTVEHHRGHIMEKLKLHSVAELTKFAIREGLTSLETRGERG